MSESKISIENKLHELLMQAEMYLHGCGVHQNMQKAAELLEYAVKEGNVRAMFKLAEMYAKGQGVHLNEGRALELYERAAKQGHFAALHSLISLLYHGGVTGQAADRKRAAELIKAFSTLEDGYIQLQLANLYAQGYSVKKDLKKAHELARLAERYKDAEHLYDMTGMFSFHVQLSPEKVFELCQKSAKLGHPLAQYKLGELYRNGQGVPENTTQALKWFQRSSEQDTSYAISAVFRMYENKEIKKEQEEYTLNLFKKSATAGDALAQFYLGILYIQGDLTLEKNEQLGNHWVTQAMITANKKNQDRILIMIAGLYEFRMYRLPGDQERIAELYRMIAEKKSIHSISYCEKLGELYLTGTGVEQNKNKALFWFHRTIQLSYELHHYANNYHLINLANKFLLGKDVDKNERLAFEIYHTLLEHQAIPSEALFSLAMMYAEGRGVQQDKKRASEYLDMVAQKLMDKLPECHSFRIDPSFLIDLLFKAAQWLEDNYFLNYKILIFTIYETLSNTCNHLPSEFKLAHLYLKDQNIQNAIQFAKKAAAHKLHDDYCLQAHYLLGTLFIEGKQLGYDESEAVKWLMFSAEQGHFESQLKLGYIYEHSQGLLQNTNQAVYWYLRVLSRTVIPKEAMDAAIYVTHIFIKRSHELEHCEQYVKNRIYNLAAKAGSVEAMCQLAKDFSKSHQIAKAIFWLQRASNLGSAEAKCELADIYFRTDNEFLKEALQLLREAIQLGCIKAEFRLGKMYSEGHANFPQDKKMAFELLESSIRKAQEQSDSELLYWQSCLYEDQFIFKDKDRAMRLLQASAELGHTPAQWELGFRLRTDKKLNREQEAQQWLQLAAEKNYTVSDVTSSNPWNGIRHYFEPATAVFWAIEFGITSCFPSFIEKNVGLDTVRTVEPGAYHSALTFAMSKNNTVIIKSILETNSRHALRLFNANSGFSPLHYAVANDSLNIFIPRLLKKILDQELLDDHKNNNGQTAMALAVAQNKHEARLLLTLHKETPFFLRSRYLQLISNSIEFSYFEKTRDHLLLQFDASVLSDKSHGIHQKAIQAFDHLCKKHKLELEKIQKTVTWSTPKEVTQWIKNIYIRELQVYYLSSRQSEVFFRCYMELLWFKDKCAHDVLPQPLPQGISALVIQYYHETFTTEPFVEDISSDFNSGKASSHERALIKARVQLLLTYFNQKQTHSKYQPSKNSPLLSLLNM